TMSDSSSISSTRPPGRRRLCPLRADDERQQHVQNNAATSQAGGVARGAAKHLTLVPADYRALLKASEVQGAT
ncbi:MAG TPA: hypothetical protein VE200_05590, partial [Xanthobacteraceae bacterium]|nr:hypothetical protein [Xanthobacteraceae bacterium]